MSMHPRRVFCCSVFKTAKCRRRRKGSRRNCRPRKSQLLKRWVAAKAPWPKGRTLDLFERTNDVRAGRDWWSLQPIRRPDVPQLKTSPQPDNPIDAFILARLEQAEMVPAPAGG